MRHLLYISKILVGGLLPFYGFRLYGFLGYTFAKCIPDVVLYNKYTYLPQPKKDTSRFKRLVMKEC